MDPIIDLIVSFIRDIETTRAFQQTCRETYRIISHFVPSGRVLDKYTKSIRSDSLDSLKIYPDFAGIKTLKSARFVGGNWSRECVSGPTNLFLSPAPNLRLSFSNQLRLNLQIDHVYSLHLSNIADLNVRVRRVNNVFISNCRGNVEIESASSVFMGGKMSEINLDCRQVPSIYITLSSKDDNPIVCGKVKKIGPAEDRRMNFKFDNPRKFKSIGTVIIY